MNQHSSGMTDNIIPDSEYSGIEHTFENKDVRDNSQTGSAVFGDSKKNTVFYDKDFIKANFCPIKLSKSDIKNLSNDFPDQTLGGHRIYREELIDGRLAKVYEYKLKIIKYDEEYLKVQKQIDRETTTPTIIIENNMILPFNPNIAVSKKIVLASDPISPLHGQAYAPTKRGRPRKYPIGQEPYKKKKYPEKHFEIVPDRNDYEYDSKHQEFPFYFERDYYDRSQTPSPYIPNYYDFQAEQPSTRDMNESQLGKNRNSHSDMKDFLSQQYFSDEYERKDQDPSKRDDYRREYF